MKKTLMIATVLVANAFYGCGSADKIKDTDTDTKRLEKALTASDLVELDAKESANYVKALNTFTFNLSERVLPKNDNAIFSGFSLHTAFDMLYQGSVDTTKSELAQHLGFDENLDKQARLGSGMRNLFRFDGQADHAKMTIANRIFVDKKITIGERFAKVLGTSYFAPVEPVDFDDTNATAKNINEFVKVNTMDMIPKFVEPQDISGLKLALVNSIALKAKWDRKFNASLTKDGEFTAADGSKITVKYMNAVRSEHYHKVNDQYEVLALDYEGNKYQMLLVLPQKSIADLRFTADTFAEMHRNVNESREISIALSVPKVKIESGMLRLNDHVQAMGLKAMFKGGLDNIAKDLVVATVLQKAMIEWNEEETSAAAASLIGLRESAERFELELKFDRPFAYYLVHKSSGAILFNGHVVK